MHRSYNLRTIAATNTAQPVVGTTITAAAPVSSVIQTLAVADSTIFDEHQWSVLDIPAAFGGGGEERLMVLSIPDATHIVVQGRVQGAGCELPHAINSIIRPSRLVSSVFVQPLDGNTANLALWICTGPNGKIDGTAGIMKLVNVAANTQPPDFFDSFMAGSGPNSQDIAEFWIVGTNPDKYLASVAII